MSRRLFQMVAGLCALGVVVACVLLLRSGDAPYTLARWASFGRFDAYDGLIAEAARKHGIEPELLKAVVWRESQFQPDRTGKSGERGLMQVGELAAQDWVRSNKIETFVPQDLYSPFTNLEVGAWYLGRALRRWSGRDNAIPFALAEYNAGKSRVDRWIAAARKDLPEGSEVGAQALQEHIDIASTRLYIESILARYRFYKQQKRFDNPGGL